MIFFQVIPYCISQTRELLSFNALDTSMSKRPIYASSIDPIDPARRDCENDNLPESGISNLKNRRDIRRTHG